MSYSKPFTFLLSVSALSINDGLGSLSAAIEQCVLAFFLLSLTCLTLQFTTALLRGLAIFPPSVLLSTVSSTPFIKSQLLYHGWSGIEIALLSVLCVCVWTFFFMLRCQINHLNKTLKHWKARKWNTFLGKVHAYLFLEYTELQTYIYKHKALSLAVK